MVQQKIPPVSPTSAHRPPVPPAPNSSSSSSALAGKAPMPNGARKPGQPRRSTVVASIPFWLGLLVSIMWVGVVILIVARSGPARTLAGLPLVDWAIGISSIASPVALIWMVTAYLQRAADIQAVAEPLRRQLSLITGESGLAETRVRRFNQAIREQLELLKAAKTSGQDDLGAIVDRIQKQRVELERFEQTSIAQVKDIQDIIRRNMQQVEHVMDDKFTQMRVLDDKLIQSGDTISRQTENLRKETAKLLQEVEANSKQLAEALDRAMSDSKRLSETTKIQETSLTTAASSAAEILGGVSSKIDLSVARFLERAGSAREEAERLASALDTQTRSLDEFSNTLPVRVKEAESVLRGVADRLHSSEKSAREQATNLTETLGKQLGGLQDFLDRFTTRMTGIDTSLDQRRTDFDALAERVIASATTFSSEWERSVTKLSDNANDTMIRFAAINDETGKNADLASSRLGETIEKYEDTIRRLHATTDASGTEFRAMTEQIASHLSQFDALRDASHKAGEEVESRASSAMENLKFVLDRLLTARDATGAVGEKLVKDLYTAVDQNESLISRLKEAAQAGVVALSTASENISQQQDGIIGQTREGQQQLQAAVAEIQKKADDAVADLRAQTASLTSLLAEAQIQMEATDRKMKSFVVDSMPPMQETIRQIDQTAEEGVEKAARFGDRLQETLKTFIANALHPMQDAVAHIDNATSAGLASASRYGAELQEKIKSITVDSLAPIEETVTRIDAATSAGLASASRYGAELQQKIKSITADSLAPLEDAVTQIDNATASGLASATRYGAELQTKLQDIAAASVAPIEGIVRHINQAANEGLQSTARYSEELQQKFNALTGSSITSVEDAARKIDEITTSGLSSATRYGENLQAKVENMASASLRPIETAISQIDLTTEAGLQSLIKYGADLQQKLETIAASALKPVEETGQKIDEASANRLQMAVRYGEELQEKLRSIAASALIPVQDAVRQIDQTAETGLRSVGRYGSELQTRLQNITTSSLAPINEAITKIDTATETSLSSLSRYGTELQDKLQGIANTSMAPVNDVVRQIDQAAAAGLQSATRYGEELQEKLKAIATASLAPVEEAARQVDASATAGLQSIARYGSELQDKLQDIAAASILPMQDVAKQIDQAASAGLQSVDRYSDTLESKLKHFIDATLPPVQAAVQKVDEAATTGMQSISRYGDDLRAKLHDIAGTSLAPIENVVKQIDEATNAGLESTARFGEDLQAKLKTLAAAALAPVTDTIRQIDSTASVGLQSATRYGEELQTKLKSLATNALLPVVDTIKKMDASADNGLKAISKYGEGLQEQLNQLQGFNDRVSGMGAELSKVTLDTVGEIEKMQGRFADARAAQEETARQTLAQFVDIAERLGREVAGLDGQSFKAVSALQEAASRVGEQSYQMLQNAETSSAKMQLVTTALQSEASKIHNILQKQTDDFSAGITRAEKQFGELGDALALRTDATYSLLDRIAAHYNETTNAAAQELDNRAMRLEASAMQAAGKMDGLSATINQHLTLITAGSAQLETQAGQLASAGSKALSQLSAVNEKLTIAHEAANNNAQQTINKLEECNTAFLRQTNNLSEAATSSIANIQKASVTFGEQVARASDANRVIEQTMRQLTSTATTLAEQSSHIRSSMDQQSQQLITRLTEAVTQMDANNTKLEQLSDKATSVTDKAVSSFGEMTQTAGQRLNDFTNVAGQRLSASRDQMQEISTKAEIALAALGTNISQQASSLSTLGEQLAEQQRVMAAANESQRTQLIDLFDKLGSAHSQASDVAERTIVHLTESLIQVQKQLGALSDQSQESVGNVRAAGAGFAEESASLLQNAQAAEAQARTVLSVTSALQDQARQLREALHGEGERAGDMLGALLSKLNAGGLQLRDLTSNAELMLTGLNSSMIKETDTLTSSMQQISERQRTLTVSLDAQRDVMNGLLSKLIQAQGDTATASEAAVARMGESAKQVVQQAEDIDAQARAAVSTLQAASSSFTKESASLTSHAEEAEQQVRGILTATVSLQEEARRMRETLDAEGARANDVLSGLSDKMAQGTHQVRELSATAEGALASLGSSVNEKTDSLANAMQQISERQRVLTSSLEAQREVLNGLLSRLAQAQDETALAAERTASRMTDSTQQMSGHIGTIDQQSKIALSSINAANAGFAVEAEGLISRAQEAEEKMRTALNATIALQEQTRTMREALDTDGARTSEILTHLLDRITQGSVQMRDAGNSAESTLSGLGGAVRQQTDVLNAAMQQISERQKVLASALDTQRDDLNNLLGRLVLAQDETATVAERTATRLAESARIVTTQVEAIDTQSRSALESVQAANSGFNQEATLLASHSQQAEQQARAVLSVTSSLQEQAQSMREALSGESERAAAALTVLLDQLALSGTRVQDIAAHAGVSLETLQGGINRQGSEIETVLAEVIRRQETLTSAMTEQREMIGALLDRMAQAQDEAARVGERTAERLATGTQEIAKQLEVMGSQAQSTLATVQSAGQGFANEAQTLRTHADAAEEKVRGILLAMGGLEEEGRKLRDAIHAEAGRVINEMSGVIAQLDAANVNLKQQSGSALDVMNTSAAQFAAFSAQGAETMRQQAAVLQETADASTSRMASAGEIIKAQFNLVGDAGKEAEANAERLAATAAKAADSMASLRHSVAEGDREGQNAVEQAAFRIEAVKATLQGELQRLSDVSQQAVLSVAAASQQLTSQSDILRANLASSESALTSAADLVREETTQLPAVLNRSTSQIEAAAKALKNQAGDTDTVLVGTADRFIAVTAIARESMVDEIRHVSSVADEADKILRQFTTTLTQQVTSMQESATVLSEEQKQIVAKSGESVAQITAASNRLAQLRNDAAATAEKLAREFDALDVRVTATGTRLEKAGETATKSMDALADLTQKAETTVLSATSGFRDQLERIRQGLQTQIDDLNRGLMQITAQLERTGSTLRSTTAGTVADVERISQRFNDTSKEAGAQLTEKTTKMRSATEEVAKLLAGFGDQLDVLLDRLSVAGDGIKRHEGSLIGQLQSALQHLSGVAERLESSRTLATNVSEQAVGRLDEVAKAVHDQMRELTSGSQAAAGIMRGIGQIYGDQTQALHRSVGEAHAEVQAMNKAVDEMQQRTDRIRTSLKLQGDELMSGLSQILKQLTTTGDALSDTVDQVLSEQAADNLKKMG